MIIGAYTIGYGLKYGVMSFFISKNLGSILSYGNYLNAKYIIEIKF